MRVVQVRRRLPARTCWLLLAGLVASAAPACAGQHSEPSPGQPLAVGDGAAAAQPSRALPAAMVLAAPATLPPPPGPPGPSKRAARGRLARAKGPAWRLSPSFGLELIYDDNILRYSDEDRAAFLDGSDPLKFRIKTHDDFIVAPSLDCELRWRSDALADTRFRFQAKRWLYAANPIKTNTSLTTSVRQTLGGSKSLEISYTYAPSQYIRELKDRPPFTPTDVPMAYTSFRYTRNAIHGIYRAALPWRASGRLQLRRTLRYYNRAFMENDIKAWEIRGTLMRSVAPQLRLTLDYAYEDGQGLGFDSVGEELQTSNDSNPSFAKDFYQLQAVWSPRRLRPVAERLTVTAQNTSYWFTSRKDLFLDPYHVGRKDEVFQLELALERRLSSLLDLEVGVRRAQRTTRSPWPGVLLSEDKDYTAHRVWLSLTYTP